MGDYHSLQADDSGNTDRLTNYRFHYGIDDDGYAQVRYNNTYYRIVADVHTHPNYGGTWDPGPDSLDMANLISSSSVNALLDSSHQIYGIILSADNNAYTYYSDGTYESDGALDEFIDDWCE